MDDNSPPLQQPSSLSDSKTQASTSNASNAVSRGSIAERRPGFKAERINTARFRSITPLTSPASALRSPCITIPPGISPTSLLDSPILLPNSQHSPTTGSFPFPHLNYGSSMLNAASPSAEDKDSNAGSFNFKTRDGFSALEDQGNDAGDFNEFGAVEPSMDFEFPAEFSKEAITESYSGEDDIDIKVMNSTVANTNVNDAQIVHTDAAMNQEPSQMEYVPGENLETHHSLEGEKGTLSATVFARNSEDGYNWRKYGQKQVKGSEYPRSYYKCTHPNCQVKKKLEHSYDGQVAEIIYKGTHNHPKPQPSRRVQGGSTSSFDEVLEMDEGSETGVKAEVGSVWKNPQEGSNDVKLGPDWNGDGLERTSSASVLTEVSDPLSTTQAKRVRTFEPAGTPELSSTLISNDDDDEATQGSISLGADADNEESESKRRKTESCLVETSLSSRAVREPRVVVQIESEIDILDDGYRWRKYGQKVVKGNPNPRSYYKCTSAGCLVRKHVERASHNLKFVITTYEGKHNHEVPAAKNSNNVNSGGGNLSQVTTNAQTSLALGRTANRTKPETQLQDYSFGFERKPVFNSDYRRPSFPGIFCDEMKLGPAAIYPLKFPAFPHTMHNSLEFNRYATHHSGTIASLVPDFQISLPSTLHTSASPSMAGVGFNYNGKSTSQGQLFLSSQQMVLPKQEQRDDHYDAGLTTIDHVNGPLSSAAYQNIMGNFSS